MKKVIALVVMVLFVVSVGVVFAAEIKGSKIETNVERSAVITSGGLLSNQDVNVGGVDVGKGAKISGSQIKTNVKDSAVITSGGLLSNQEVNVGGVKVK